MFNLFKFAAQEPPPDSKTTDSYFEKLVKYIPADILAAYVAITGITASVDPPLWLGWGVFGALLALTPLYVCFVKTTPKGFVSSKMFHWVTACLAFSAWVFAMGGPFATFAWYQPYLGSVVLILTTLIIPVLEGQFYPCSTPPVVPPVPPVVPPAADPATPTEPPSS
jgi:apolipoprotein N-acyltransferase